MAIHPKVRLRFECMGGGYFLAVLFEGSGPTRITAAA